MEVIFMSEKDTFKQEIFRLIEQWEQETAFWSDHLRMRENENYRKIISKGKKAIRPILQYFNPLPISG